MASSNEDSPSSLLGEPFYYCQACSDMIHLGNRKCSHPLSQLINVDEVRMGWGGEVVGDYGSSFVAQA